MNTENNQKIQFKELKEKVLNIKLNPEILKFEKKIEELSLIWISLKTNISKLNNLEVYVSQTTEGYFVEFYNSENLKKYTKLDEHGFDEWFITVSMVQELLSGKNPKKVENKFKKRRNIAP